MLWGLPDETERGKLQKTGSLTVIGDLTEATNSWPNLLFCDAGVPEREDERALRGGGVRDQQQPICDAVPNNDHFHLGDSVLLHGPASSGLHALPLLRALPLRERDCRREPDDGHRQRHPELPDGHHHRGWDSGFLYLLASHPYHVLTPCTFGLSASSDALLDLQMFRSQNLQGIFMLLSGYFRLRKDIPKPFWRYPMSYISFHFWALQVNLKNPMLATRCSCFPASPFGNSSSTSPPFSFFLFSRDSTRTISRDWCSTGRLQGWRSRESTSSRMCSRSTWGGPSGSTSACSSAWSWCTASYSSWWSRSTRTWPLGSGVTSRGGGCSRRMGALTRRSPRTVCRSALLWVVMRTSKPYRQSSNNE